MSEETNRKLSDLGRVGITPDPNKMATAKGKELASKL